MEIREQISHIILNSYYGHFYRIDNLPRNKYILCYHGMYSNIYNKFNLKNISFLAFKKQINFLKKHFEFIGLDDFFNAKNDGRYISLTFDDGMLSNYIYLYDFLDKNKIPATFFITGYPNEKIPYVWNDLYDFIIGEYGSISLNGKTFGNSKKSKEDIRRSHDPYKITTLINELEKEYNIPQQSDSMKKLWDDILFCMNNDQIKKLSELPFVEVGSHGYWHRKMEYLSIDEAVRELKKSKEYLEGLLNKEVVSLAYPFGSYRRDIALEAEKLGFKYQLLLSRYNEQSDADLAILKHRVGMTDSKYPYLFLYSMIHMPDE